MFVYALYMSVYIIMCVYMYVLHIMYVHVHMMVSFYTSQDISRKEKGGASQEDSGEDEAVRNRFL